MSTSVPESLAVAPLCKGMGGGAKKYLNPETRDNGQAPTKKAKTKKAWVAEDKQDEPDELEDTEDKSIRTPPPHCCRNEQTAAHPDHLSADKQKRLHAIQVMQHDDVFSILNLAHDPNMHRNLRCIIDLHVNMLYNIIKHVRMKEDHKSPLIITVSQSAIDLACLAKMIRRDACNIPQQVPVLQLVRKNLHKLELEQQIALH
ncbi:hypothetical protein FRC06_006383 [Ceratobasidium sp. 370]|nr:hypothetical protein FRC06_006383 [Ceratobasidium sp. 370]